MNALWGWIQRGYLRVIGPVGDFLVRRRVKPNTITTIGTICTLGAGVIFATGHIRTAGWFLGLTALFDVLDGTVARRTGTSSVFGAFYDSTLDRVSDGALLGGLAVFYAVNPVHQSTPLLVITLLGLIGAFLTSYTRARAEALGVDAKVGLLQRPERITLLSAPQAFFGLALDGWVLAGIVTLLSVTAWITVAQRMHFVYRMTDGRAGTPPATTAGGSPSTAGAAPAPVAAPPVSGPVTSSIAPALAPVPGVSLQGE
jgi:CDP-diacylglycerol--glycerol-3-phosphate 3-phosphatidyltransferase